MIETIEVNQIIEVIFGNETLTLEVASDSQFDGRSEKINGSVYLILINVTYLD